MSIPRQWFKDIQHALAVGPQGPDSHGLSSVKRLYGACVCVNRDILLRHLELGGEYFMSGRTSSGKITSGDDAELCEILKMHGYLLYYDRSLAFSHDIPSDRLAESYLSRLFDSFGDAFVSLLPYRLLGLPYGMGKILIRCPAMVRLVIRSYQMRLFLSNKSNFYKKCQNIMCRSARLSLRDSKKMRRNMQVYGKLKELRVKLK